MMTRLHLLLLLALIASALYLVQVSYEGRRLFAQLDAARNEYSLLEAEGKRLEAERQIQATSLVVDRVAREKLQMRPANPAITHYVDDTPSATGARP